ncbi:MAG: hypothetical protein K9N47_05130 [Prosthecobacter sp.]|nr:hypothetical protein [Prosthecobacter sp.]
MSYSAIMNPEQPVQPAEFCLRRTLADIKSFAQREPGQAVAAAVGAGLLINMLPTRWVAGTAAVVGAMLVRPVLLSLGVTKAMELCCQNSSPNDLS